MSQRVFSLVRSVVLLTFALLPVAPGHAQGTVPTVSKLLAKALDERYPQHWALATIAPAAPAPCPAASQAAGPILTGDFNGDGVSDLLLQIAVAGQTHVVVALTRLDVPQFIDLDVPPGPLVVHQRGQSFKSPESMMPSIYLLDTIGNDLCGSGDVWMWTGAEFRKMHVAR